jgi:tetratricopeptide (TPR) repeat protein
MKSLFRTHIPLASLLLITLPIALAAQDEAKPKNSGSKVVASVNADVIAARKATAEKRYGDAEALMLKDTSDHPELIVPRVELGLAEIGLEKYAYAESNFKKVLGLDTSIDTVTHSDDFYQKNGIQATHASRNTAGGEYIVEKNRDPEVVGAAWNGLAEIYIRQKHYKEAEDAYDSAAQINTAKAGFYRTNETIFFFKAGQSEAQLAAAEKAIAADPTRASLYYFKAQALVSKATIDPQTQKMTLPPGCAEAYQKYLQLEPNGQFSADAKGVLTAAGVPVPSGSGKKS